jgi:pimeloyl-ACP methyl ester carboxylesterase
MAPGAYGEPDAGTALHLPAHLASGPNAAAWAHPGRLPLVLLHGMGSTASVWLPQLEHFGRTRRVLAWTMPGYGASPAFPELSWPALADALAALANAQGLARFHLLGHSIGGMVAQVFAQRHPGRLASLVLSATSAGFGAASPAWKAEFLRQREEPLAAHASFAEAAPQMLARFCAPCITPARRALAELSASGIEKDAYLRAMRLLLTFDGAAQLAQLEMPVLLVAGSTDEQAPLKAQQRLLAHLPQGRLAVLEGLNHMANLEDPERFNACVEAFVNEVESANTASAGT